MSVSRSLGFTHVAPPSFAPAPPMRAGGRRDKTVLGRNIPAAAVEQYRKLAAGLHHAQVQHGTKVVMMASTLAGEGKTLTATNLALTLSESYRRRVALIDADLRRPTIHDMFGLPNVSGLNDVLSARGDASCEIFDMSPCLSVLTAGRPNPDPISGLTSERMRQLVAAASEEFEWVILDTPPVGLLPDAGLLGGMVDTVVLVVAAGRNHRPRTHLWRGIEPRRDRSIVGGVWVLLLPGVRVRSLMRPA
jgi:capsular exopolysaccharide synthesis family protein